MTNTAAPAMPTRCLLVSIGHWQAASAMDANVLDGPVVTVDLDQAHAPDHFHATGHTPKYRVLSYPTPIVIRNAWC